MISKETLDKIKSGATVRVWEKVKEGEKDRVSRFEGMVLARKHGSEIGATFTVRGVVAGIGVEKVFPINSPRIDKVDIINSPKKVSRSKLYYVRDLSKRETRKKLGTGAEKEVAAKAEKKVKETAEAKA
jgi:large subunit ribosomal protein L19